jgi:hypothetical protein
VKFSFLLVRRFCLLFAISIAFSWNVCGQTPTPAEGQTREKGIKVRDGDKLEPNPPPGGGNVPKTVVHYKALCDALKNAAQQSDRKEKKLFEEGPIKFYPHEPWIADLICDYIEGAAGDAKNPGPFGCKRNGAVEKKAKDQLPTEYAARQQFLSKVLAAFQSHSVEKWKAGTWVPPTMNIATDRLLVGATLFKNLVVSEEKPDKLDRKDTDRFVARSVETPDHILFGMKSSDFWGPVPDQKIETGGAYQTAGVKAWIIEAERFLLRAHALACGAALVQELNLDYPTPESRMGKTIEDVSHKFQDENLLRNIGEIKFRETVGDVYEDKKGEDNIPDPAQVRRSAKFVELTIDRTEIPAKANNGQDVPGLSLFVYQAMEPGPNHGDWYVKSLALVPADQEGEPGGITLPLWAFRNRGLQALTFADRMFDETTKVPVESRFEASAVCVARIHYSKMRLPKVTQAVLAHELNHFRGIRNAWISATGSLERSLGDLATNLNRSLGNLQGPEAFSLQSEELRDVWKLDPKQPDASAIPVGPLRPEDHAAFLHTNQKVSYLRMRLKRRLPRESGEHTLLEMLDSKKQIDPLFDKAQKIVEQWKLNHWRDSATNEFRRTFVREFTLAALNLDNREGVINDQGQQSGRDLDRVIAKFNALLARFPNKDPLVLAQQAYQ